MWRRREGEKKERKKERRRRRRRRREEEEKERKKKEGRIFTRGSEPTQFTLSDLGGESDPWHGRTGCTGDS